MTTKFETFLNTFDEKAWLNTLTTLLPEIHEVDRIATQIWFRFYPLELFRTLQNAENKDELIQKFVLQGEYELKNQIDSSHKFLYGHRFWKETKDAIVKHAENFHTANADLPSEIREIAKTVAQSSKTSEFPCLGITMVGLMTLAQVGLEAFKNAEGKVYIDGKSANKSPKQILEDRAKDDSQGVFGFLKTIDKKFSVIYDENQTNGKFKVTFAEDIATASSKDQSKNWKEADERCWEGVVPVECRSASCGTCWVGVIGGQEKLSEVARLERKQMKVFGYNQTAEAKPFMRLACQAKAEGNVTIVIPPWNGVFGKKVYDNVELAGTEPATAAARALREKIASAVKESKE
jgi:ferredoxin